MIHSKIFRNEEVKYKWQRECNLVQFIKYDQIYTNILCDVFLWVVLNYETKSKRNERTKRNEMLRNATKYTKLRNETQRNETKFTIMRNEMK